MKQGISRSVSTAAGDPGIGKHLSPDHLEESLGIKKSWLYGHVHAGTLPFDYVKVGHYLRFPERSVKEYLDRMTREAVVR